MTFCARRHDLGYQKRINKILKRLNVAVQSDNATVPAVALQARKLRAVKNAKSLHSPHKLGIFVGQL
jgi:hypothetical protein